MHAQFVHVIKADSVLITNDSCTAELNLENSTKNVKGFLYNKGNGRTEFRKVMKLNDTTFIMGGDTLIIGGSGASRNFANSDLTFTGDRWYDANYKYVVVSDLKGWYMQTKATGSNFYSLFDLSESYTDLRTSDGFGRHWGFSGNLSGTLIFNYGFSNKKTSISLDTTQILFKVLNTNRMAINSNGYIGMGTTTPSDKLHVVGTTKITDTLKLINIASKSDTATCKPIIADASGNVFKMSNWPVVPLTFQQVTGYGNTTSNTIKPYPSALPIGSNSDSVVVWSASDSLLKKIGFKQTFAQTATVTISATTDQTTLISSGTGSLIIPAASWFEGKTFKVVLHGTYSTSSTNPPSLTIKIKLGTTVIATGTVNLSANKSDVAFEGRAEFTCRSTGSSGTVFAMGMISTADGAIKKLNNGITAFAVDLSTNQTLNITATLSDASAGNAVSAYVILLEAMN